MCRASPFGAAPVFSFFASSAPPPWRSAFSRFALVVNLGFPVLASVANRAVKPTCLRQAAYFRSLVPSPVSCAQPPVPALRPVPKAFKPFGPPALVQQAPPAILLAALRRFRGPAVFRGPRPSSSQGAPFWPSGLTLRSSGPAFCGPLTLAVSTTETLLYLAHVYSNRIQFLKRCAALGLPFLRASPVGITLVCALFGLWPLCSKRKQLLFS